MKFKLRYLIIGLAAAAFFTVMVIIPAISNRVPSNDISVTGNTGGNLNNQGLFCEQNGRVFFSNAYDHGCMYSMNADETDMKKMISSKVTNINADDNFVYYFMDSSSGGSGFGYVLRTYGIYRTKQNGKSTVCLLRDGCTSMQLAGDYLYYLRYNNKDYSNFYKIKTDKSENILISDELINPAACHNGIIYYNGTQKDHYLYALDTRTDAVSTIYKGNLWYPVYKDDYIYYMDVSSNYRLCRYSLVSNVVEVLTPDRVDAFNVGGSYIYYQKNDAKEPALMRMRLDGSEPEIVAMGNYQNINITSQYVYFNEFNNPTPVYHTPAEGPVYVDTFTAAEQAAVQ